MSPPRSIAKGLVATSRSLSSIAPRYRLSLLETTLFRSHERGAFTWVRPAGRIVAMFELERLVGVVLVTSRRGRRS